MSVRVAHLTEAVLQLAAMHGEQVASQGFVSFLNNKKLVSLAPRIVKELQAKVRTEATYNTLNILVPFEPSESLVEYIKNYIHAQTGSIPSTCTITIDASLIGGFKATYRGTVFDGSVSSLLQTIR